MLRMICLLARAFVRLLTYVATNVSTTVFNVRFVVSAIVPMIALLFYASSAHAQLIKWELCNKEAINYIKNDLMPNEGLYSTNKSGRNHDMAVKLAKIITDANNRIVNKGGMLFEPITRGPEFAKLYGKPDSVSPWSDGGAGAKVYTYYVETGIQCAARYEEQRNWRTEGVKHVPYVWDEAKYFVGGDGRVKGWLRTLRTTQLCDTAPKPCMGATKEEKEFVTKAAAKVAAEDMTWLGAPISELANVLKNNSTFHPMDTVSDGRGGKVYTWGSKDKNNLNNSDYSQVDRYFVNNRGIIYAYGGWLDFGAIPICAGGGNMGACGAGGKVLFHKHVDPSKLRRDGN